MSHRLLALVIGLTLASSVRAFDSWPQWLGPNRNGISPEQGLLDHWEDAPPLLWKVEGIGIGYSGVLIDHGVVCTMGEHNGKTVVLAIRDKDGKEIWRTVIDAGSSDGGSRHDGGDSYSGPRSTPTMDGERIYAVSEKGILACLKTATGELVWKKDYTKNFNGHASPWGYCESPLIDGDKLICSPGGYKAGLVALDKKTGTELWRCKLKLHNRKRLEISYSSPVISYGAGIKQYVKYYGGGLGGFDAETGKQLWLYGNAQSNSGGDYTCVTPIVYGDYVFVSCAYGGGSALVKLVRKDDGSIDSREIYYCNPNKLQIHHGQCVLVGNCLYFVNGESQFFPTCIEFLTGKMRWNKIRPAGRGSATVAYADGHLYFLYADGVMTLVAATPDKYQPKGKFRIPGRRRDCWAYPAICNGRLYVRNGTEIYCYDIKKK